MQTLDPPTLLLPELRSIVVSEQVIPGNVPPDTDDGNLGDVGPEPEPLQGGGDAEAEKETGNEGAGT
jgi:hypothetical protein